MKIPCGFQYRAAQFDSISILLNVTDAIKQAKYVKIIIFIFIKIKMCPNICLSSYSLDKEKVWIIVERTSSGFSLQDQELLGRRGGARLFFFEMVGKFSCRGPKQINKSTLEIKVQDRKMNVSHNLLFSHI